MTGACPIEGQPTCRWMDAGEGQREQSYRRLLRGAVPAPSEAATTHDARRRGREWRLDLGPSSGSPQRQATTMVVKTSRAREVACGP
jgi:hypothetical protein